MALKVGIVRDERYLDHMPGHMHPEHPRRLKAIYQMLDAEFPSDFIMIEAEPATLAQLELVHSPEYIQKVLKTADHGFTNLAPDTPTSAKSYLAAWLAAGGCLKALESLMDGRCDICFALRRPPGHHALHDRAGGFCILNNLAVTARYAMRHHSMDRIMIIDWDVHHGNGIHDLFYKQKEVLYISSHDILLYPYTGRWEEAGSGQGEGYTVNIPIPRDLKDDEFAFLYREILAPAVARYRPRVILVAAGFDGHMDDPIGRSQLSEKAYGKLIQVLLDSRNRAGSIPILLALEGGYDPRSLSLSVKEVLKVLTGRVSAQDLSILDPGQAPVLVEKAKEIHAGYGVWCD